MISRDWLRKKLCENSLSLEQLSLRELLIFLYIECDLSTCMIANLTDNHATGRTIGRVLFQCGIPTKSRGGLNNPWGRAGSKSKI